MMREIKFRFIYKSENKYCHKVYSLKQLIERPLAELCDVHNDWELVETLQYTGLKDKNGKEIWEGDILNCGEYDFIYIVALNDRGCFIAHHPEILEDFFFLDALTFKIIGNIYENKDLLTKNK